jgi:DNA-binding XRE family transcriptional regulator
METVTLTKAEYQDLIDARDHAIAMRDIATGAMDILSEAQTAAFLAAASPLAFWRQHRGMTQAALAAAVGISQPYLAQIEAGKRVGDVNLYAKLARALTVRIEDLVEEK